jgi:hypothetical protein
MKIMLILSLVEIEIAISKIIACIMKFIYGYSIMDKGTTLCMINAVEYQWIIRVELNIVAILSLLRYLIVCRKIEKSFKFWLLVIIIMSIPCSYIFFSAGIINDVRPSLSRLGCYAYSNPGYVPFIMTIAIPFLYFVPCWIITICYFSIGLKVNRQLNEMRTDAKTINDTISLAAIQNQKFKIILQLTAVIIIYNFNFALSYTTLILKFAIGYNRSPIVEALTGVLTYSTFTLNPILAITFQPELNHELTSILFYIKLRLKTLILRII